MAPLLAETTISKPAKDTASSVRNHTADALRGLAALAVCWYHFTHGNEAFLPDGLLKTSGNLGWVGVEVFFVISGYAMMVATRKTSLTFRDYGQFMAKRLVRLHPPYVVAVLLILLLGWLSTKIPGFNGAAFSFHVPQFLSHLVYAPQFFHQELYNPVFWTLCVEVQWYLVIGLIGGILHTSRHTTRWGIFSVLLVVSFLPSPNYVLFRYLPLFCFGIAAFYWRTKLVALWEYVTALLLCAAATWADLGFTIMVAALVTSFCLASLCIESRPLLWLGGISYSLYLLHVPIGGRIINLAQRFPQRLTVEVSGLASAVVASVVAAYLLWKFVEAPSHRAAQLVGKRPPKRFTGKR